jgi:hypothetical protein
MGDATRSVRAKTANGLPEARRAVHAFLTAASFARRKLVVGI